MTASATEAMAIYHLKIVLMDVAPTVWRRFQVPASMTLGALHRAIQILMGWKDWHMYQFHIAGEAYGPWQPGLVKDEQSAVLGQLVPLFHPNNGRGTRPVHNVRSVFRYEYDPRDLWQHEIRVEKISPPKPDHRYPRCTAGAWGAPPEDCGGPEGFLKLERGGDFIEDFLNLRDDEVFDVDSVNAALWEAFSLEPEPEQEPESVPKPPKPPNITPAETAISPSSTSERLLPEPFETIVRGREGRASPEQERAALVDLHRMIGRIMRNLQLLLGDTRSKRDQTGIAMELSEGLRTRRYLAERIAEIDAALPG
jgi:hypothetical protein